MHDSYYRATTPARSSYPSLRGHLDASVCVVGGGFAGLNTVVGLVERGVEGVVLIEAGQLGFGASGRNGGFVFGGFSLGESELLRQLGPQRAKSLYRGTLDAVELVRERISRYMIDCDAVETGVIWANWFRDPAILKARQALLAEHFDAHWQWLPQAELRRLIHSERYGDALFERQGFHFHPLKYVTGLAEAGVGQGLAVHEHTAASRLERDGHGWRVHTADGGCIRAGRVVLACGGYLANLRREVDASILPIATYVMVTGPLGTRLDDAMRTRAAVYDTRFAFDYYRPLPDTRLLWGGRISVRDRSPDAVRQLLYGDMLKVFPQLEGVRIDHAWSGLMSYARHQMPQVGQVEPGLWMAQAFGGHGVAPTAFAGELLASAIAEGDTRWRELDRFGLASAWKPAGFAAAQLSYWWAEARDAWKAAAERG